MSGVNGIGGHCCCPPCDCRVCVTVTGCGGAGVTADIGLYTTSDCTGTPVATDTVAGGVPTCLCIPGPGTYHVKVSPTGAAASVYQSKCVVIEEIFPECAVDIDLAVHLAPITYDVAINVMGVSNDYHAGDAFGVGRGWYPCSLWSGISVTYSDGTNTVTDTTDADGQVTFSGLTTPAGIEDSDGTWQVQLSSFAAHSGWANSTITYTLTYGMVCVGVALCVTPNTATGYVWTPSCKHPLPKVLSLTWSGATVTLTNPDTNPTLTVGYSGNCLSIAPPDDRTWYGKWLGCGTISCTGTDKAATTASCSGLGDPLGPCDPRFFAWSETTGSATVWFLLQSHRSSSADGCDDPDWTLYATTWVTSYACPGEFLDPHPCLSVWVATSSTTQESRTVDCSFTLTNDPAPGTSYPYVCNTATLSVLSATWTEDVCDPIVAFSLSGSLGTFGSCGGGDFEITG